MKKQIRKWLIRSVIAISVVAGLLLTLILYPNNLFAKRNTYRSFTIYSEKNVEGYQKVLDNALKLVKASELYDSSYHYDIFLTDKTWYKDATFKILGPSLARTIDNNILLNIEADFRNDLLASPYNKRNLTGTIAHEMVHCLQANRYGIWKFNPASHPPLWKLEGYPEYVACAREIRSPGYDFAASVQRLKQYIDNNNAWVQSQPGFSDPIIYYKGRVMIEYLMDVKGMSYDEILKDKRDEEAVYRQVIGWFREVFDKRG